MLGPNREDNIKLLSHKQADHNKNKHNIKYSHTHTSQTCSKMLHRKNKLPQSFLNGTCGFDFQEKVTMTLFHIYFTTDVTIKAGLTAESSLVILLLSVLAVPTERIFRALRVAQSRNCKMGYGSSWNLSFNVKNHRTDHLSTKI